jgi:hypothetical protein
METAQNASYKLGELTGAGARVAETVASALKVDKLAKKTYENVTGRSVETDATMATIAIKTTAGPITDRVATSAADFTAKLTGGDPALIKDNGTKIVSSYVDGFTKGHGGSANP